MKVTMNVVRKQFVNKEGEVVPYFGYFVEVNGIEIRFAPYESDKKLASYLFGKVLIALVWTSEREDVREVEDLKDEDLEDIFDMVEDERSVMTDKSVIVRVDIMALRD